jgi:hypothetical protein
MARRDWLLALWFKRRRANMTLGEQILWGSLFLGNCLLLHVACLVLCARVLEIASEQIKNRRLSLQIMIVLFLALLVLLFAITAQVWIWSAVWVGFKILPGWNSAVYFTLVTFTTLGYGDLVLGPEVRIFGTFAAVTGLLSFGLSTAFLVAVTQRLLITNPEKTNARSFGPG